MWGEGLGLGNHIAISTRGVIICRGVENGHNTGADCGHSSQLGLYRHFSEASQKRLFKRLYSDLSCHIKDCQNGIYLFEFPEKKKKKKTVFIQLHMHTERKTRTETVRYEYVLPLHP